MYTYKTLILFFRGSSRAGAPDREPVRRGAVFLEIYVRIKARGRASPRSNCSGWGARRVRYTSFIDIHLFLGSRAPVSTWVSPSRATAPTHDSRCCLTPFYRRKRLGTLKQFCMIHFRRSRQTKTGENGGKPNLNLKSYGSRDDNGCGCPPSLRIQLTQIWEQKVSEDKRPCDEDHKRLKSL